MVGTYTLDDAIRRLARYKYRTFDGLEAGFAACALAPPTDGVLLAVVILEWPRVDDVCYLLTEGAEERHGG